MVINDDWKRSQITFVMLFFFLSVFRLNWLKLRWKRKPKSSRIYSKRWVISGILRVLFAHWVPFSFMFFNLYPQYSQYIIMLFSLQTTTVTSHVSATVALPLPAPLPPLSIPSPLLARDPPQEWLAGSAGGPPPADPPWTQKGEVTSFSTRQGFGALLWHRRVLQGGKN